MAAGWIVQNYADGSSQVVSLSPSAPITLTADTVSLQLVVLGTGIHHASSVTFMVGGVSLTNVLFSADSDWPGLDTVAGSVPASLAGAGTVPVYVSADGISSNTLNLTFK